MEEKRFFLVEVGNGFCGCNESWLVTTDCDYSEEYDADDIISYYSYESGFAGCSIGDDEEDDLTEEEYHDNILENICVTEIDNNQFEQLLDEGLDVLEY